MDVMSKSGRRYPPEMRERACRLVTEWRRARERSNGGFNEIGAQLGVHPTTLAKWYRQARIDAGDAPGRTTSDDQRIAELEAQVRELERSNEILRTASAFFAAELDRPPKR